MRVWLEYFVKLTQTYVCNGRIKKRQNIAEENEKLQKLYSRRKN